MPCHLTIVCGICRTLQPRAAEADQDICSRCLRDCQERAGVLPPRPTLDLEDDFRLVRESLVVGAGRWVSPANQGILRAEDVETARRGYWQARDAYMAQQTTTTAQGLDDWRCYFARLAGTTPAALLGMERRRGLVPAASP